MENSPAPSGDKLHTELKPGRRRSVLGRPDRPGRRDRAARHRRRADHRPRRDAVVRVRGGRRRARRILLRQALAAHQPHGVGVRTGRGHARAASGILRRLGADGRLHRDRLRLDDRDRAVRPAVHQQHLPRAHLAVVVAGADRPGGRARDLLQRDPDHHPRAADLGGNRRGARDDPERRDPGQGDLQPRASAADVHDGTSWCCRTEPG